MDDHWRAIETGTLAPEAPLLAQLLAEARLDSAARARIVAQGAALVRQIRADVRPGLMEVFLAEYGLSTEEGVALMCLAEALLRVPDAETMDALIEDKIAPSDWGRHLGKSASSLVNASTWGLMLTGKVLEDAEPGIVGHLRNAVRRLGEPVIRVAVGQAMKEMGRQFVLGQTISAALQRAKRREAEGFSYSYDMLGEAARTAHDAARYGESYAAAIADIAAACPGKDPRANPGISVKLSALHPRYEHAQQARVMQELVPVVIRLARAAAAAGMGFNIDAEEADRLSLSLRVIEAVLSDEALRGWDGFGVVVQAYGRRAGPVIDWLHALATRLDRRIMVRLVKGAYWDGEIKRAQVAGLEDFPVFTRKHATDVSYIALARKLLELSPRIYPQFATHNAHTVAAVLEMAQGGQAFEFQRLHGMGERLHDILVQEHQSRCRIYAPVGAHRDLLAYLVRRLLENGANSSFVNQIVDSAVPPETVAACPLTALEALADPVNPYLSKGPDLFLPERSNSSGFELSDGPTLAAIDAARGPFAGALLQAAPMLANPPPPELHSSAQAVQNPATGSPVGYVRNATAADAAHALAAAAPWDAPAKTRAAVLARAADLLEADFGPIFALLAREAGKTLPDAVGELREAVDFLRYYAAQAPALSQPALGVFACISPWNFPLAIFTGQVAAALAAGNGVLAKPAEQTPLIAAHAVQLLHAAGVPRHALQFLPGDGPTVGAALISDPRVSGVAFTGSTETARIIRRAMAAHLAPDAPLIAETGGLNAMIVDSSALPEQAVRDVIASAFQSAGQRCSALRCLYVQEDIAPAFTEMLFGAMDELRLGDPWELQTDIGPLIDAEAHATIGAYIERAKAEERLLKELPRPEGGYFISPTVLRVHSIAQMQREIFGPVLHLASFRAADLGKVVADINATGYGLTFGLHTRIDNRVQEVTEALNVGNIYVNRNQIGAVVGSQPFGGEGLSGTGPKAGGPAYLPRFTQPQAPGATKSLPQALAPAADLHSLHADIHAALAACPEAKPCAAQDLPGPTGESNRLIGYARAPLLCLGPGAQTAQAQQAAVWALGGRAATLARDYPAALLAQAIESVPGISAVLWWGDRASARSLAQALAARDGPILPLITALPDIAHVLHERVICIDTTASGGNAALLAGAGTA